MPAIAIISMMLAALSASPAHAEAPWCANYGGGGAGGTNCGFYSFQQCMAAISGNGGYCSQNLFYTAATNSRKRTRRDH